MLQAFVSSFITRFNDVAWQQQAFVLLFHIWAWSPCLALFQGLGRTNRVTNTSLPV